MNLLLMGMRASGKTTVGRLLAARLGWPFIDLDDRVLPQFRETTVQAIWEAHGEQAWRKAEARALTEALSRDKQVIALGGGVPMHAESRVLLEYARATGRAKIAYLKCSAPVLKRRLLADAGDRPSITGQSVADEVESVLAARERTYTAYADVVINTEDENPETLAARMEALAG